MKENTSSASGGSDSQTNPRMGSGGKGAPAMALNQKNQTSLSLLGLLEKRLDSLLELKDQIDPPERFEAIRKIKEREWREKQREMRAQASK